MKAVDRFLQRARMRAVMKYLGKDLRVIDVGAHEGELFKALGSRLSLGFGVEPLAKEQAVGPNYTIDGGYFPDVRPSDSGTWDAVTMLAVLEHVPCEAQGPLAAACADLLKPGGRVLITVPSPMVDHILNVLKALRLIDGMSLEEHYGFEPGDTVRIFGPPAFRMVAHRYFQFGLNNLFVFEKV